LSSNPPIAILVNSIFSGSTGVNSTLQYTSSSVSATALASQVTSAITNAPASSSSLLGGFVAGSLSVAGNKYLFFLSILNSIQLILFN